MFTAGGNMSKKNNDLLFVEEAFEDVKLLKEQEKLDYEKAKAIAKEQYELSKAEEKALRRERKAADERARTERKIRKEQARQARKAEERRIKRELELDKIEVKRAEKAAKKRMKALQEGSFVPHAQLGAPAEYVRTLAMGDMPAASFEFGRWQAQAALLAGEDPKVAWKALHKEVSKSGNPHLVGEVRKGWDTELSMSQSASKVDA